MLFMLYSFFSAVALYKVSMAITATLAYLVEYQTQT